MNSRVMSLYLSDELRERIQEFRVANPEYKSISAVIIQALQQLLPPLPVCEACGQEIRNERRGTPRNEIRKVQSVRKANHTRSQAQDKSTREVSESLRQNGTELLG